MRLIHYTVADTTIHRAQTPGPDDALKRVQKRPSADSGYGDSSSKDASSESSGLGSKLFLIVLLLAVIAFAAFKFI